MSDQGLYMNRAKPDSNLRILMNQALAHWRGENPIPRDLLERLLFIAGAVSSPMKELCNKK